MKIGSRNKDKNVEHHQHRGGGRILQDPIGWESPACTCMMPWCPIASRVKTRSIEDVHDLGKPCKANNICSLYICIYIYKEESEPPSEPTEPSSESCRITNKSRPSTHPPRPERLRRPRTTSTMSQTAPPTTDHVDHVPSSSAELRPRPRRPCPKQLRRAPTTTTSCT